MRKVAVYCGTRNLYQDMLTAAKSLLVNSSVEKIYFIIEDEKFPYLLPSYIECISVKNQKYFKPDGPNYHSKWTYMVLIRAALSKILPQEDLILSLDVDTIIDKNIDSIWNFSMDNYYIAGAREPAKTTKKFLYINFGVCLLNLKLLRETNKDNEILDAINTQYFEANEQDCFNIKCQGKILEIPSSYNANHFTLKTDDKKIIHYAGIDKWQDDWLVLKYKHTPLITLLQRKNNA